MAEEPIPVPEEDAVPAPARSAPPEPVEALLGFREFLAVAPRRRSQGTTVAASAALQRWMRQRGHDIDGHYSLAQWTAYYEGAMQST